MKGRFVGPKIKTKIMIDFAEFDKEIDEISERAKDVLKLVQLVIGSNKCEFKTNDINFDFSLLVTENVIKVKHDKIELQENSLLHYLALQEFYKKFDSYDWY